MKLRTSQGPGSRTALFLAATVFLSVAVASAQDPEIRSVRLIVVGPSILDHFVRPTGLAVDPSRGLLVIADAGSHRLVLYDSGGRCRGTLPCDPNAGSEGACEPHSVALDASGRLYVIDALSRDIEVRTPTGARLALFDPEPESGSQCRPQDLAVGRSGRIYLVYAGKTSGLLVVQPVGQRIETVLRIGFDAESPFIGPAAIAVNTDESVIAVVDPAADRIVKLFDPQGNGIASFGKHGEGDGTFSMAAHATWGPGETLWVVDQIRHSVSVFDRDGTYRGRFGGFGAGPGQFDYPIECAFLAPDRIVVLERAGARFQVLDMDVGIALGAADRGRGSSGTGVSGVSGADPAGAAETGASGASLRAEVN